MKKKLLVTLLLFTVTIIGFGSFAKADASIYDYYPEGKNYLDANNFTWNRSVLSMNSPIEIKPNTDYTFSINTPSSSDMEALSTLELITNGVNDYYGSFSLSGGTIYYTFNSADATSLRELYVADNGAGFGMHWDYYGFEGVQLEEGTTFTAYEIYDAPTVDETPPLIDGTSGVHYVDVDNPTTVETVKSSLTATDGTDGDVTASIAIVSDDYTANKGTPGTYNVVYSATDSTGNVSTITIEFRVVDVTDPIINLDESTQYFEYGSTYNLGLPLVSDNYDTTITAVKSGDTVDTSVLGTYTMNFNATDSSGNTAAQKTRTVVVRDTTKPTLALNGSSTIYVEFGSNYSELGADWTDNYDGTGSANVSGAVDISTLGSYTITYSYTDSSGNTADSITRTVVVRDTLAPNIVGETTANLVTSVPKTIADLLADFSYNDLFSSAANITVTIIDDTYTGNEIIQGSYSFTIQAVDENGNVATEVITVNVTDDMVPIFQTTALIFSIDYANTLTHEEIKTILGK